MTKCAMEQMECIAYYQDAERVLTPEIIHGTGIDMSQVLLEQPETIEEVFDAQETTLKLIKEKRPDTPVVITMDSVAAWSTQSEIEGDMEDAQMAPHARLMSKGLRKIKGSITDTHVLSLWVNQTREKIGQAWGDKDETFGGRALKFYSSVRIKLTKIKTLKKTTTSDPYGCTIEARTRLLHHSKLLHMTYFSLRMRQEVILCLIRLVLFLTGVRTTTSSVVAQAGMRLRARAYTKSRHVKFC